MALTGCGSQHQLELTVAAPAGSPAIAFYNYLGDTNHLEVNSDANNVLAYFGADSKTIKDIIVAPTNAGVGKINSGAPYKIAATVTFGNFFLLSTGKDTNNVLDEGDKVLAFQENGVAGKLYKYLYGDKTSNVTYVADAKAVNNAIADKDFDYAYVLLAQPVVYNVLAAQKAFSVYASLQNDYKEKTGKELTQASIFIRNTADKEKADAMLKAVKSDIEKLVKRPNAFLKAVKGLEDQIIASKATAKKEVIVELLSDNNALGMGFKYAKENKEAIDTFVKAVGMGETSEEIYYSVD